MRELTDNLHLEAVSVGPRINADKTKLMKAVNMEASQTITAGGKAD